MQSDTSAAHQPCPTCGSGPMRETVDMVCQTCGRDYGSTMFFVLLDALRPLCDDLPGEPPALIAWGPEQLARKIAEELRANGWKVAHSD